MKIESKDQFEALQAQARENEANQKQQVLVCCGTGGVGKTSVSAALGVAAAREGINAVVLTVDPARRLASALGLEAFGNAGNLAKHIVFRAAAVVLMGDVDNAARVDHVIGRIQDVAIGQAGAVLLGRQLVVGGARNDAGADLRDR